MVIYKILNSINQVERSDSLRNPRDYIEEVLLMKTSKYIVSNIIYDKVWEDQFYFVVYENEACMEYEQFKLLNPNASKKMLINEISKVTDFSTDIIFVIDNIVQLKSCTVLNYCRKVIIIVENNQFTLDISEALLNIFKKLATIR